jgi:hypothetical protein
MFAKIPFYVSVLILIILTLFLIVREGFIGFDEAGVPAEKRYPLIPKNSFSRACLPSNY